MKLQKLVFFVHAWSLALHGVPGVSESPGAWQYGPVFSSLYQVLKGYGASPITNLVQEYNPNTGQAATLVPNEHDSQFWELFEQVWARYGRFSALQLSALTHEAGGPWERAYKSSMDHIPDDWLASYYQAKLASNAA